MRRLSVTNDVMTTESNTEPILFCSKPAHVSDALSHVRDIVLPVVFVFNGGVADEILVFQFLEDVQDATNTGAKWNVVCVGGFFAEVFQVDADDAAAENFQAVHRS